MTCLQRYWLKEFFKFFGIIQLMIMVLFVLIDYLSRMDKFLESQLSLIGGFGYVLLKVPFMFAQLTPASVLLATLVVFGLMNRNNELLAIRSSGISIYSLVKPALLAGAGLALVMFFFGETLVPVSMAKANHIQHHVIKNRQNYHTVRQDIWIKSDHQLVHINFFDPVSKTLSGISMTTMNRDFSLNSRIDARKGIYRDGQWVFFDVVEQVHHEQSMEYDVFVHDTKIIPLAFHPEDLGEIAKKSEEMSFFQLRQYARKVEQEGYDARVYTVDLNGKLAFPFICVIMVLTGAATGMRGFVKENIPAAVAIGVVISFLYWVMYGFCLSLGYGGILPPVISAWITNVFFSGFGILYLIRTE